MMAASRPNLVSKETMKLDETYTTGDTPEGFLTRAP